MQDGCKAYTDLYMTSSGLHLMVIRIISKNHLLEVGVTQNQETVTLQTLMTVDLSYSIMDEDPHEQKLIETPFG